MVSFDILREHPLRMMFNRTLAVALRESRPSLLFCSCAYMIVVSLLLGGGTRGGFLSDAILELLAIPALLISLFSLVDVPWKNAGIRRRAQWALGLCSAIALLPLIQLVPLPPWIWTNLPGREQIEAVFDLLGNVRPWMPISVSPGATWLSFLSLLAPIAIFSGMIQLGYRERRGLSLIVIALGVVSVFLGLTQVAEGPNSALRFFAFTNTTEAVGFFANRNHLAALLYAVLPFAAAWAIDVSFNLGDWSDLKLLKPGRMVALIASFVVLIILIAGEAVTRSRAGLMLTIGALAGIFALAATDRRNRSGATANKLLIGVIALAIILAVQFGLYRILGRFTYDALENARITFAHNTIQAAAAYMPFGSGLGTFVPVYQMFEKPSDAIARIYVNHAHDDVLELWLETGIFGMAIAVTFVTWFAINATKIWRHTATGTHEIDRSLAGAATIVITLLIAHSLLDYPLRTGAMMAIFAFACSLLVEPLRIAGTEMNVAGKVGRQSSYSAAAVAPARSAAPPPPVREANVRATPLPKEGERWGDDVDWPEQWRSAAERNTPGDKGPASS